MRVRAVLDLSNRPHFESDLPFDEEYARAHADASGLGLGVGGGLRASALSWHVRPGASVLYVRATRTGLLRAVRTGCAYPPRAYRATAYRGHHPPVVEETLALPSPSPYPLP